jgi:hypothetical protein
MTYNLTEKKKVLLSIDYFNNKYNLNLVKTVNQYEIWDAEDKENIIEFKFRNKYYENKYIQIDKFLRLIMAAQYYSKTPYYCVKDEKGYFFYNLEEQTTNLLKSKIITQRVSYQTDFSKNNKINKYFYQLKPTQQTQLNERRTTLL